MCCIFGIIEFSFIWSISFLSTTCPFTVILVVSRGDCGLTHVLGLVDVSVNSFGGDDRIGDNVFSDVGFGDDGLDDNVFSDVGFGDVDFGDDCLDDNVFSDVDLGDDIDSGCFMVDLGDGDIIDVDLGDNGLGDDVDLGDNGLGDDVDLGDLGDNGPGEDGLAPPITISLRDSAMGGGPLLFTLLDLSERLTASDLIESVPSTLYGFIKRGGVDDFISSVPRKLPLSPVFSGLTSISADFAADMFSFFMFDF